MLYDQALLVRVYCQAYTVLGLPSTGKSSRRRSVTSCASLRHGDGGFYSAEDADSPDEDGRGVEGLFHTWTVDEVHEALAGTDPTTVRAVREWFGISQAGNFEGRSIPNRMEHRGELARPAAIETARLQFQARSRRRRPGLDDKILTEWNALFLYALETLRPHSSVITGKLLQWPTVISCFGNCGRRTDVGVGHGRPTAIRQHGTMRLLPITQR